MVYCQWNIHVRGPGRREGFSRADDTVYGMAIYTEKYWHLRQQRCRAALEENNFVVNMVETCHEARRLVMETILPAAGAKRVSWGDSLTLYATGILDDIRRDSGIHLIETFAENLPRDQIMERRRQALSADLFFTGTNAVTETGKLVNLDMVGNRVSAMAFGPKGVIVLAGRNKIVPHVEDAMERIKGYTAPLNAMRHDQLKTPCRETGRCIDCNSPDRICNVWSITEKCFPPGRIRVVLINRDEGL